MKSATYPLGLIVLWIYTATVCVAIVAGWGGSGLAQSIDNWQSGISQFAAMAFLLPTLREAQPGWRRRGWALLLAAVASDAVASLWWIFNESDPGTTPSVWFNAPFLAYYPLAAAGFAAFFLDLGGSFRKPLVWLDLSTLALGLGATLWLFLVQPELANSAGHVRNWTLIVGYPLGDGMLMVIVALVIMQISDWRRERSLVLLIAATALAFTTDLDWIGLNSQQRQWLDIWSKIGGYSLFYALLATAAVVERRRRTMPAQSRDSEASAYSFLPILSVLVAVAMLLGERIDLRGAEGAALIAFVLIGTTLVAARQQGVRQEIHRLHRTLAKREADTHLTELIRRSSDLIVVVDARRELSFVSPGCDRLLGTTAESLQQRPASLLLGEEHEARLTLLLDEVESRSAGRVETEVVTETPRGDRRSLQVIASDQRANPAIAGITLTLSDVTDQRRLEREVLDAALRERERLAGELRAGLGAALADVPRALNRLKSDNHKSPVEKDRQLSAVIGSVNGAIATARRLALDLSPLHEVRGSLGLAFGRLTKEYSLKTGAAVSVDFPGDASAIPPDDANHLYRIAQSSLDDLLRQGHCTRARITLRARDGEWLLTVSGSGPAAPVDGRREPGFGARLSSYRARVMGGTFRQLHFEDGSTGVEVAVPIAR